MSHDMRPEVRHWGPSAGVILSTEAATDLLDEISALDPRLEFNLDYESDPNVYHLRWPDGVGILSRFRALDEDKAAELAAGFVVGRKSISAADVVAFVTNLRACAPAWERYINPDDGSLELLVNA